jgi:hypothetical protein
MRSFSEGIDALQELVGKGHLVGTVEFDQVYAVNQHEGDWVNFMGRYGPKAMEHGRPKFLEQPLLEGATGFMQTVADHTLHDGPAAGMIEDVEKLADESSAEAPVEFGDLKGSAHPVVTSDGSVIYDRPPLIPRLSEGQLAAKASKSAKDDYTRTYLDESHPLHGTTHPTTAPKPEPTVG